MIYNLNEAYNEDLKSVIDMSKPVQVLEARNMSAVEVNKYKRYIPSYPFEVWLMDFGESYSNRKVIDRNGVVDDEGRNMYKPGPYIVPLVVLREATPIDLKVHKPGSKFYLKDKNEVDKYEFIVLDETHLLASNVHFGPTEYEPYN